MASPRLQFEVQVKGGGPEVDIIDIIDIPCYLQPPPGEHGRGHPEAGPGDHPHPRTPSLGLGHAAGRQLLVAGLHHLVRRGQVDPQL